MNILAKYKLKLNSERKGYGWFELNYLKSASAEILNEVFMGFNTHFDLLNILKEVHLVKIKYKESFNIYGSGRQFGSILIKDKVYITTNEDEFEEIKIAEAFDVITIEEFEEILKLIYDISMKNLSDLEHNLLNIKHLIDKIFNYLGIENIVNVYFIGRSIKCYIYDYVIWIKVQEIGIISCDLFPLKRGTY